VLPLLRPEPGCKPCILQSLPKHCAPLSANGGLEKEEAMRVGVNTVQGEEQGKRWNELLW
jgi:hypothetical protein